MTTLHKMKNFSLSFFMIIMLILGSCTNDGEIDNTPKLGLLKSIEGYFDGELHRKTEISYDEDLRLTSLKFLQGNFSTITYDAIYIEEEIKSIIITNHYHPQHADTTTIVDYDVTYQNKEIILTEQNSVNKMVFETTDGYVDSFKFYWGDNNEYVDESVFKRDANNNIDSTFNYTTNQSDNHLLIWNYAYSDFDVNANFNSAYNPVFNYSFCVYRPLMGVMLNIKISKETPLKSSFSDGHGTYREENITAKMLEYEYGLLKKISYEYVEYPENDYHLEFDYY